MLYKDLPSQTLLAKLEDTSFGSAKKDVKVYLWCKAVQINVDFFESQRRKLIEKYGYTKSDGTVKVKEENLMEFYEKIQEILNLEVENEIPKFPIEQDWFDDCEYSDNKKLWLNAKDIEVLMNLR